MNKFIVGMFTGLLCLFAQTTIASQQGDQKDCVQKIINKCIQTCEKNSRINCTRACQTNVHNECRQAGE